MDIRGDRVKAQRKWLQWTQQRLADESGLSQSSVSKVERGEIDGEKANTQKVIARALGVSVPYLLGETDDPSPTRTWGDGSKWAGPPADTTLDRDAETGPSDAVVGLVEQSVLDAWARAQVESPGSYSHELLVAMQPAARKISPRMAEHADRASFGRDLPCAREPSDRLVDVRDQLAQFVEAASIEQYQLAVASASRIEQREPHVARTVLVDHDGGFEPPHASVH